MATGYQDWGRQTPATGQQIINYDKLTTAAENSVLSYCAHFPYLDFTVKGGNSVNYYTVEVLQYDDEAATILLFDTTFVFYSDNLQTIEIPCVGQWVKFGITPLNATDAFNTKVYVRGSLSPHQETWSGQGAAPLINYGASLAASTTQIETAKLIAVGPATLAISNDGTTSWHADVQYYENTTSLYTMFIRLDGTTWGRGTIRRVSLPAAPVRVIVTNDDAAAAHNFYVSLTAG